MQTVRTYISKYSPNKKKKDQGGEEEESKKTKSEKYIVRYKYIDDAGKIIKESSKRGFKRSSDAKKFAETLKGVYAIPTKLTMTQLFDIWFMDYKSDDTLAQNTILWHYYNLRHLHRGLGSRLAQEIDLPMLNTFLSSLKKPEFGKALNITTISNIRRTLNQALDFGVEMQYLSKNPLKSARRKRNTKKVIAEQNQFKAVAISQTKIIELIESISDPCGALAVALAGLYGLRRGEIRGLIWEDIDFECNILYIRKQLCGNAKERDILKTISSERSFNMTDYVSDLINQVRDLQNSAKLIYGNDKFKSGYVLAHHTIKKYIGMPFSANYYSEKLQSVLGENGMQPMRLHDLRHSYGSNLLYQGIPIPTVSKLMGHKDVATTAKIYAHVIEELKIRDEKQISLNIEQTVREVRSAKKCSE